MDALYNILHCPVCALNSVGFLVDALWSVHSIVTTAVWQLLQKKLVFLGGFQSMKIKDKFGLTHLRVSK